ncbi:MAG: tetratricopeptide repeat protein [Deltaproteobacteria bacterium]|nr:tetratricopeptide repeat protein [Deltaproteobacteria bacterium]
MKVKRLILFILFVGAIPFSLNAYENCPVSDAAYYENCMIEKISSLVSEKKYSYAIDMLNGYENWFRSQKQSDVKSIAKILSGKAAVYYLKGDYEEALKGFNEVLKYYDTKADADRIAETKTNISVVLASLNNYNEALQTIGEAEQYYRKARKLIDLADVIFNKGIFYYFSGDYPNAFKSFSEAEKIYLAKNLKIRYLSVQVLKGIIKAKSGEYRDALYMCENNMLSFSLKYYCIALANDGLGKREEAEKAFKKAVEKIDKNISTAIGNSGDQTAQALSEKYSSVFTDYLLFMLKNSMR